MTTQIEALKLAREVLGEDRAWLESDAPQRVWNANSNAMIAIDEALSSPNGEAQPSVSVEQPPSFWLSTLDVETRTPIVISHADKTQGSIYADTCIYPVYTTPPQEQRSCDTRKPFTDAQVERLYRNIEPSRQQDARSLAAFNRLLRVIEAAHGIKENT